MLKFNSNGRKLIVEDFKILGIIFFGFLITIVVMTVLKHGFGIDMAHGRSVDCDKNYTDTQIDYWVKPYLKQIYDQLSLPFNFITAEEATNNSKGRKLRDFRVFKKMAKKINKNTIKRFYWKLR